MGHFGNSQNLIYHNRKYSMKRIFIIIVVIIIFIAVGFGVYFGWKKSKEILTPPMAEQGSPQGAASQTTGFKARLSSKFLIWGKKFGSR